MNGKDKKFGPQFIPTENMLYDQHTVTDATSGLSGSGMNQRETQIEFALALALLGDNKGIAMLQKACDDTHTPAHLRMYAAKYILDTKNGGCLSTVENFLLSAPDLGSRQLAFSEITRFQHVSDADAQKIFAALVTSLRDAEPQIRTGASGALAELGNQSAVPELQKAIAAENGDAVRSSMHSDLRKLQEKVP